MHIYVSHNQLQVFSHLLNDDDREIIDRDSEHALAKELKNHVAGSKGPVWVLLSGCYGFSQKFAGDNRLLGQPTALAFAVEEFVPANAEAMSVSAYAKSDLVFASPHGPVMQTLAELGGDTKILLAVRPALVTQWLIQRRKLPRQGRLIIKNDTCCDLVTVENGVVTDWRWYPNAEELGHDLTNEFNDVPLFLVGDGNVDVPDITRLDETASIHSMAYLMTEQIHHGKMNSILDLEVANSNKSNSDSWILKLTVAVSILLLSVSWFLHVRTQQMNRIAGKLDQQVDNIVQQLSGSENIPLAKRWLENEVGSLTSLNDYLVERPFELGALQTRLKNTLEALPQSNQFTIDRIDATASSCSVSGSYFENESFPQFQNRLRQFGFLLQGRPVLSNGAMKFVFVNSRNEGASR